MFEAGTKKIMAAISLSIRLQDEIITLLLDLQFANSTGAFSTAPDLHFVGRGGCFACVAKPGIEGCESGSTDGHSTCSVTFARQNSTCSIQILQKMGRARMLTSTTQNVKLE